MSCEPLIQVENLSKCYEIYKKPFDRLKQFLKPSQRYYIPFWALQEINFSIYRGQSIGILGANGSGKSTLLQLISGILTPTTGKVVTRGKIAALIELGSGFNPEFTGLENIYLNATLLGLTQNELNQRLETIIAFADIGKHLNLPVKTYSSGMVLRLAFAVQIVVEPDILIIDEALAVGDAKFQLKCYKRLEQLKANGTTILLVSHATEAIRSFCDFALVLDKGLMVYQGEAKAATVKYLSLLFPEENQQSRATLPPQVAFNHQSYLLDLQKLDCHTFGVGGACLNHFEIKGLLEPNIMTSEQEITVIAEFTWDQKVLNTLFLDNNLEKNICLGIALADKKGVYVFGCNSFDKELQINCLKYNSCCLEFSFQSPILAEGDYFMTIAIAVGNLLHHIQLKWYDCAILLKFVKTNKNAFGVMGINYQVKLQKQEMADESITAVNL
ncbi:MAG: ABC transporter ATP-binding protein [Proteobacteria bacterium]|nr:ABC transporter ATP-binding protein [Pseudomonadota bacterium]